MGKKNSEVCISLTIYLEAFRFFFFFFFATKPVVASTACGPYYLAAYTPSRTHLPLFTTLNSLFLSLPPLSLMEMRDAFNEEVPL